MNTKLIVKGNGKDCNEVYPNGAFIIIDNISSNNMKNTPNNYTQPATLITFNIGRMAQIFIGSNVVYTRINQGEQTENTWSQWIKISK